MKLITWQRKQLSICMYIGMIFCIFHVLSWYIARYIGWIDELYTNDENIYIYIFTAEQNYKYN